MNRRPTDELLDSDSGTPQEVAGSLLDLRWFNRWWGGITTTRALLQEVSRTREQSNFSILDVAAGDGFLPNLLREQFQPSGVRLQFTLLDRAASHLPKNGRLRKIVAKAPPLPFADSSFDLVSSSLFLHHLAPESVVRFASEALRVCRHAVLVHDLIRHPLHLALAYAGAPLYRSRITRNDAPASVRQAFTGDEMRFFFTQAGATRVDVKQHFLYRMGVIAWKS
jgi:ubiquinone/menaquinone biosynthesis C-methylase UbiE